MVTETIKTHKDLDAWKESVSLAESIYRITKDFPSDERFGLVAQLRRAAVSIPSNIAEGATRHSSKEFIQFLYIALASTSEIETQLILSEKLGYISAERAVLEHLDIVRKLLVGLIKSLKNKIK
ncbi:four helix bundle protein [Candidatus Omnitrophota bacterium]